MDPGELTPAEVAKRLGVSTATVRRYDERGLLRPARRLLGSNYRRYSPDSVAELQAMLAIPFGPEREAALLELRDRNLRLEADPRPEMQGPRSPEEVVEDLQATFPPEILRRVAGLLAQQSGPPESTGPEPATGGPGRRTTRRRVPALGKTRAGASKSKSIDYEPSVLTGRQEETPGDFTLSDSDPEERQRDPSLHRADQTEDEPRSPTPD